MNKQRDIKSLCVFCGSCMGFDEDIRSAAKELGSTIAKMGIKLIYGGSSIGLMRIIADSAINNSGSVIGIIPQVLLDKNVAYNNISQLIPCSSISDRKNMMIEMSDCFVALPGGLGTLDEITEVLTYNQLKSQTKLIALLNINHFYDNFINHIDTCVSRGFIRKEHRQNILIADNVDSMLDLLFSHKIVTVDSKWVDAIIHNSNLILNNI